MKFALALLLVLPRIEAQDPSAAAAIDEAFRLAGVRSMLEGLPSHVNQMTAAAVAQLPRERRQQFEPLVKDVSLKFLDPDAFYGQLRTYFLKHYDPPRMATFLALERTTVYRTMNRLKESADSAAGQAGRRRFEANLKSDPPSPKRVEILRRMDEATNATTLQAKIVAGIVNATSAGLGAQMPSNLDSQTENFIAKIRPILGDQVLVRNLFVFRNTDDATLEDYVAAEQQPDVAWFNRNLQAAILAVVADRAARAGEYLKDKAARPGLN